MDIYFDRLSRILIKRHRRTRLTINNKLWRTGCVHCFFTRNKSDALGDEFRLIFITFFRVKLLQKLNYTMIYRESYQVDTVKTLSFERLNILKRDRKKNI